MRIFTFSHLSTYQLIKEIREETPIRAWVSIVKQKKEALAKRDPQEVAEGYAQLLREELMR